MPRVSFFYGIAIYIYWNEGDHHIPYFHVIQAEQRASVSVEGVVLAGKLERRALDLVARWARLHRDELFVNWELARDNQQIRPIAPLP